MHVGVSKNEKYVNNFSTCICTNKIDLHAVNRETSSPRITCRYRYINFVIFYNDADPSRCSPMLGHDHPYLHARVVLEEEARIGRVDVPLAEQMSEEIMLLHP